MSIAPVIVWFRIDLRLDDNPAVRAAVETGAPICFVYLWDPASEAPWAPGGASNWWLHHSLARLGESLSARGAQLVLRSGDSAQQLESLAVELGASAVFWNRRYEPQVIRRDAGIKTILKNRGLTAESFNAALLHEPWTIATKTQGPYQVFTPYWRACLSMPAPAKPWQAPARFVPMPRSVRSEPLASYALLPTIPWDTGFGPVWQPGEVGAQAALKVFVRTARAHYATERDVPGRPGTSRLSPHLHFGEIGPRQIWEAVREASANEEPGGEGWMRSQFIAEVGWREFAHHLLYHFPRTPGDPLRSEFSRFPWRSDPVALEAWQRGRTGVPLVDAGMRELWQTGWMHNRVRMVVASFLVKNLLIPWQQGAAWFWDTLVDADLASNTLGWQWTAGCGADAAPYFRVFNPVSQAAKFDPDGDYIRRWVPELARLRAPDIFEPWTASPLAVRAAGVELGLTYPFPIIPLSISRNRALEAYAKMRSEPVASGIGLA